MEEDSGILLPREVRGSMSQPNPLFKCLLLAAALALPLTAQAEKCEDYNYVVSGTYEQEWDRLVIIDGGATASLAELPKAPPSSVTKMIQPCAGKTLQGLPNVGLKCDSEVTWTPGDPRPKKWSTIEIIPWTPRCTYKAPALGAASGGAQVAASGR
jgi:hypothetical protein